TRLNAVVHTTPRVVLDANVVARNELLRGGTEDRANGRDDRLLRTALVAEGDDHGPLGRQMALVNGAGDVLLDAEELEVHRCARILNRGVPFVGPGHGDGDGISRFDADVEVAASSCGMVSATRVHAGGLHRNGLAVRRSPVEDAIVLRARDADEGTDKQ